MDKFVYDVRRFEAGVFDGLIFEFELKEPVSPDEVSKIEKQLPDLQGRTLIINGKDPAWLYCMIMWKYLCRFPVIAVYDPELQAAVIVSSHLMSFKMGDLIQLKL
jgi:CRISPR-associated Csx3 family protein